MHPVLAGLLVAAIALTESLALVGLLVPGTLLMFGVGTLVATGALHLWPTLAWAVAGAMAGDGISYWLGHHYRGRIGERWPFRRHPEWLARGHAFMARHGGKGVLFGRFVGPVRPIVPLVAGITGMPPRRFLLANVVSALAWGPVYLLPGVAFGASLRLAGQVATRLAALLLIVVAVLWFTVWFVRVSARTLGARVAAEVERAFAWTRHHPLADRIVGGLFDPSQPEFRGLVNMALVLVGATWLFLGVLDDVLRGDPLVRADLGVFQLLAGLRSPWGDSIMVCLNQMGDPVVLGTVVACVLAWLAWRRQWRTAAYWVGAVGFGFAAATSLHVILHVARTQPAALAGAPPDTFPSSHATMSVVVYGFFMVLASRDASHRVRWGAYAVGGALITAVLFARLYFGLHWLSDVLGGLALGLAWVALLGIAYERHRVRAHPITGLRTVGLVALVVAGGAHVGRAHGRDLRRLAPRFTVHTMDAGAWWDRDWRTLPAYRVDLGGEYEQPLNVQWAGRLDAIGERLRAAGWEPPLPLTATSALHWLLPAPNIAQLPVLPLLHEGRHESLLLVRRPDGDGARGAPNAQWVIRLWPADVHLTGRVDAPLWIGNVSRQSIETIVIIHVPRTRAALTDPLAGLEPALRGLDYRTAVRPPGTPGAAAGTFLLVGG